MTIQNNILVDGFVSPVLQSQAGKLALANASVNLAGRVENRPWPVEFCIGDKRDCPIQASVKKISEVSQPESGDKITM